MRTDTTITNKQIVCRNAMSPGHGDTYKARVGYWIVYSMDGTASGTQVGRMIGNVSAPALEQGEEPVKNWLLVMVLSQDMTHCYQRWVKPTEVQAIYKKRPRAFLNWFTGKWPKNPTTLIRLSEYGTLSAEYIHHVKQATIGIEATNKTVTEANRRQHEAIKDAVL